MPMYDYRCQECGHQFTEIHAINDLQPDCPECESEEVQRLITSAPTHAKGMLTPAGTSRRSSKEELRAKWREETPKLRKKLRDKLGEQYVKDIPSLNANFDD
ncbi:MAG: zinc ribbon domain-containing protein [Anaerolineae bacterium]|nr:zinc ribbon domain-containing protein [Anaerolineae bacterium]